MRGDRIYLLHIRDAIARILDYTSEGKEAFFQDTRTQDAVVRNLETIGEAVKNLSVELKSGHSDVPWRRIAGMRDKMIHQYFSLDLQIVWAAVERNMPELKHQVDTILQNLPE